MIIGQFDSDGPLGIPTVTVIMTSPGEPELLCGFAGAITYGIRHSLINEADAVRAGFDVDEMRSSLEPMPISVLGCIGEGYPVEVDLFFPDYHANSGGPTYSVTAYVILDQNDGNVFPFSCVGWDVLQNWRVDEMNPETDTVRIEAFR